MNHWGTLEVKGSVYEVYCDGVIAAKVEGEFCLFVIFFEGEEQSTFIHQTWQTKKMGDRWIGEITRGIWMESPVRTDGEYEPRADNVMEAKAKPFKAKGYLVEKAALLGYADTIMLGMYLYGYIPTFGCTSEALYVGRSGVNWDYDVTYMAQDVSREARVLSKLGEWREPDKDNMLFLRGVHTAGQWQLARSSEKSEVFGYSSVNYTTIAERVAYADNPQALGNAHQGVG